MTPYIVGRRAVANPDANHLPGCNPLLGCNHRDNQDKGQPAVDPCGVPQSSLRAGDVEQEIHHARVPCGMPTLRTWGWSAATFGAGAILGWIASGRIEHARRAESR